MVPGERSRSSRALTPPPTQAHPLSLGREHARFIVEGALHPSTVVSVKVEKQHLRFTGAQDMRNRHSNIVVDAKAGSVFCQGEMQPPSRMKDMEGAVAFRKTSTLRQPHHRAHSYERPTRDTRRGFMHARPGRCVSLAKAIAERQVFLARNYC